MNRTTACRRSMNSKKSTMETIAPTVKTRKPSSGEDHEEQDDEEGRSPDEISGEDKGDEAGEE